MKISVSGMLILRNDDPADVVVNDDCNEGVALRMKSRGNGFFGEGRYFEAI